MVQYRQEWFEMYPQTCATLKDQYEISGGWVIRTSLTDASLEVGLIRELAYLFVQVFVSQACVIRKTNSDRPAILRLSLPFRVISPPAILRPGSPKVGKVL